MPTISDRLRINTQIGDIEAGLLVTGAELCQDQISFRAIQLSPKLPPKMNVKKCTLLLLVVEGMVDLEEVILDLTFNTNAVGNPCTGQCLDAQEWSENGSLVVIGTEDGEALSYRYTGLGLEDQVVVEMSTRAMKLRLRQLGLRMRPSFHFIVAENDDPESVESSAWFAVDQSHDLVLGA